VTARYQWDEVTINGSYVYVDATEPDPAGPGRRQIPLTPQHTGGIDFMWERPGKSRLGFEAYYTGEQALDEDPYRTRGKAYLQLGLLGELTFDKLSVFVNAENLLNIRQTKYQSLLLPQRAADGGWTVDAWAPLEGLMVNVGVRFRFGDR
jgi:iron complex outermembrane receptor protein